MKRLLSLLICCTLLFMGCSSDDSGNNNNNNNNNNNAPRTNIPDAAFEQALIDLGFDNALDGSVSSSSIEIITDLILNDKGISSLQGVEDFIALENLWANDNSISSVNLSQNTNLKFIFMERNMLSDLQVTTLADLEKIGVNDNQISSINIGNNFNLQQLTIPGNELEQLDVSNNPELTVLNVIGNPLTCIRVSAAQLTNTPAGWQKDEEDVYSVTCN